MRRDGAGCRRHLAAPLAHARRHAAKRQIGGCSTGAQVAVEVAYDDGCVVRQAPELVQAALQLLDARHRLPRVALQVAVHHRQPPTGIVLEDCRQRPGTRQRCANQVQGAGTPERRVACGMVRTALAVVLHGTLVAQGHEGREQLLLVDAKLHLLKADHCGSSPLDLREDEREAVRPAQRVARDVAVADGVHPGRRQHVP
mmetsp:Transcript_48417/g.144607  ORF Transcript_48417/g.144607 Transcript_48417/m.144607 type:complete len:200 (+) Transcript_48417:594-1193(+)